MDILGTVCAKWNCRAVMRSGSECHNDTATCTLHDCFILKKDDAVRFVVIYDKGYRVPCSLKWGVSCG